MSLVYKLIKPVHFASFRGGVRTLSTIPNNVNTSRTYHPPLSLIPVNNAWISQRPTPMNLPFKSIISIDLPCLQLPILEEPPKDKTVDQIIDDPSDNNQTVKEAVNMLIIRRKKMKKHKLKKLRKRMRFENAKKRQRRELIKEKNFHALLIGQCKEAESFSAEQYVADKLKQFKVIKSVSTASDGNLNKSNI